MAQLASVIGSLAATASTVSFAPQAWKIIKSRHTADISARVQARDDARMTAGVSREYPRSPLSTSVRAGSS
jgi:hypothetical protein